ncbi:MAG: Rpn family recombination-promoting nuclease/putative transposase [Pseudomonadota bacterium]
MTLSKFLDPKNDVAFKKIFGSEKNKDILIDFINDILELKGNDKIEWVKFLSTIQNAEIASKKQSIVDVLCKDKNGVQIIVEMQVAPTKGFEKRAQYYAAKAYSRQLNKGKKADGRYENLKAVIFIAIASYIVFPDKKEFKSDHIILDKNSNEHDLQDFSFTFVELPKFKKKKIEKLDTTLDKWCYFFKNAAKTSEADMQKIASSYKTIGDAYEVVNQYNWSEQQLLAYEQETKRVWDNIAAFNYQLDKAKAEGKAEGKLERDIEIAKKMLSKNHSISDIEDMTGLTISDIEKLK